MGKSFGGKAVEFVESFFDYYLKGEKEKWQSLRGDKDFIEIPAELNRF